MLQNRGVWEPMSRSCDWRKVEQGEKRTLHQFPGIKKSEIGTDDFYKTKRGTNSPPTNGQCNTPDLHGQSGGTKSSELNRIVQEI